ncbi:unnamed protein product [Rotaria socialis]|uniref:Nuclear receptor domain-containing protein n=3 Tax=Rotaria socialis TaxID=392032 RepID=A0A818GIV8_9BILA|nr:unnamed protein product [Rotaria socialis]CAF3436822.1 unnamed protein product [Rotaria socialis]CAF3455235.1 unnamed protein product [Rotaria socialis]CAF3490898.1 unnamed protein product [Rotaria socialis]CAF3629991.1 unnamed protein product [Rotaria socialis]
MALTKRSWILPLVCQVCGDRARGMNFEVMTCMSCKAFFRRHALNSADHLKCQRNNHCEITRLTRGSCSACRLRKCFTLGMNPKLIRCQLKNESKPLKSQRLSKPTPRNLLEHDISTLTNDEWDLLSNIIHAYDRENSIEKTKHMLEQQSSLPPKLRTKSTIILDIVGSYYSTIQSFLSNVPYYSDLSFDARRALIKHNSETVGSFHSVFIVRESNALNHESYIVGCSNIYGTENFDILRKFMSILDKNGTLVKAMLLIISFAGNCSKVVLDHSESMGIMSNTISSVRIQNILITMFWKYLIYQYGFLGAVKCFDSFIRYVLNIILWTETNDSVQHSDMLDTIIENTTRLLIVED